MYTLWQIFISANCQLVKELSVFRQSDTHLQYWSAKCHEWFFPSVSGGYHELAGWPLTLDDVHCNLNVARVSQSQRLLQAAFAYHMNSAVLLWLLCKKKSEASHSVSFYQMYNILHHSLTCSKQLLFGIWYVPVVFKMINYGIPNTWGWRGFLLLVVLKWKTERERERNLESIFPLLSAVLVLPWQHGQVSPSSQGKCNCCLFLKARVNIQHLTLSWLLNTSKSHICSKVQFKRCIRN